MLKPLYAGQTAQAALSKSPCAIYSAQATLLCGSYSVHIRLRKLHCTDHSPQLKLFYECRFARDVSLCVSLCAGHVTPATLRKSLRARRFMPGSLRKQSYASRESRRASHSSRCANRSAAVNVILNKSLCAKPSTQVCQAASPRASYSAQITLREASHFEQVSRCTNYSVQVTPFFFQGRNALRASHPCAGHSAKSLCAICYEQVALKSAVYARHTYVTRRKPRACHPARCAS